MHDDDLTPSEKKEFETLPRERMPSAGHEDAVVQTLRTRGLLGRKRRRVIALTPARVAAVVAASVAFVVAGFALGQWSTLHQITSSTSRALGSQELSAAASLQYAATAYLSALDQFAALPDSTADDDARQGREVAIRTLYTAADRVSRMVPREYLAGQLLDAIDVSVGDTTPDESGATNQTDMRDPTRGLVWF